jgi:hypothetical protein
VISTSLYLVSARRYLEPAVRPSPTAPPALSQPLKGNEIVRRKGMFPVDGLSEDNPIVLEDKAVVVKDFFGWLTRLK